MTTGTPNHAEINVTPMIDILLVLLLIFMLIVPQKTVGLKAQIPADGKEAGDSSPVVLRIAGDGVLTINTQIVTWNELRDRFAEIYARRADKVLFIGAAPSVEFNNIAQAVDTAKGVGVDHVAFMPRDQESGVRRQNKGGR